MSIRDEYIVVFSWCLLAVVGIVLFFTLRDEPREYPRCWEDEVLVRVVSDPYGNAEDTLGCVPADNLPTIGNRP